MKTAIEQFFKENNLSLTEPNKVYPNSEAFIQDFKILFEKYVTIKIGGKVFKQPFKKTRCKDCVFDYIIKTQIFYKSLNKE